MAVLASDTFVRSNQSGWGTSSDGESWAFTGATATESIASNEGLVKLNSNNDTLAQLGTNTSANQEITCRIAVADNGGDIAGVLARFSSANNTYKLLYYSGAIHINKTVSGTGSNLANSGAFTLTNNTFYWFKFHVASTSLFGKVWQDGTGEPSSWTVTTTDASLTSGGFALLANTNSAGGVQFDHFQATDGTTARDIGTRLFLAARSLRDIETRVRIAAQPLRDIGSRVKLQATALRDTGTRYRLQVVALRDVGSRVKLQSIPLRDISSRFIVLATAGTQHAQDLLCRILIAHNPAEGIILTPQHALLSSIAVPGEIIPVFAKPALPYSVNGIVLDTQPTTMTAPFSTSNTIPAGSPFILTFAPASPTTQSFLSQGSIVTLRFGLVDGGVATGLVQVVGAGLVGNAFITSLIVLQPIQRGGS